MLIASRSIRGYWHTAKTYSHIIHHQLTYSNIGDRFPFRYVEQIVKKIIYNIFFLRGTGGPTVMYVQKSTAKINITPKTGHRV
jgi:hypothetical protein